MTPRKLIFAWLPVQLMDGRWVWLRKVWRHRDTWTTPFFPHFHRYDIYSEPK